MNTAHQECRGMDLSARRTPEAMKKTVDWMLGNLRKQFERIGAIDPRPSLLTDIAPEHETVMRILERTLERLAAAISADDSEGVLCLYRDAVNLTETAPYHPKDNPSDDPRRYYWQTLSWYPEFEALQKNPKEDSAGNSLPVRSDSSPELPDLCPASQ